MKIALIGVTGHWHSYAGALARVPGAEVAAVCVSGPDEKLNDFDAAPGVTPTTPRFFEPAQMLERCKPDVVQICARPDRLASLSALCLERGTAVISEKPLALSIQALEKLYAVARRTDTPILPMHVMRDLPEIAAVKHAIQLGVIGTPLLAYSQKSYRWGATRPEWFKSRSTFPGIVPYVGMHAIDWLYWMLGDVFTSVQGSEGTQARPDFPGSGSQAACIFALNSGGTALLSLDYLRPAAAPTHGDDRVRIAGIKGVVEARLADQSVILITESSNGPLSLPPRGDLCADFLLAVQKRTPPPVSLYDAFRITEIALRAQEAADSGKPLSLKSVFDKN